MLIGLPPRIGGSLAAACEADALCEGPGVDPALAAHAFERFRRADRARGPGGTGLGLAIVRSIAEAHGGSARLAPLAGGGTEAVLRLPA